MRLSFSRQSSIPRNVLISSDNGVLDFKKLLTVGSNASPKRPKTCRDSISGMSTPETLQTLVSNCPFVTSPTLLCCTLYLLTSDHPSGIGIANLLCLCYDEPPQQLIIITTLRDFSFHICRPVNGQAP